MGLLNARFFPLVALGADIKIGGRPTTDGQACVSQDTKSVVHVEGGAHRALFSLHDDFRHLSPAQQREMTMLGLEKK